MVSRLTAHEPSPPGTGTDHRSRMPPNRERTIRPRIAKTGRPLPGNRSRSVLVRLTRSDGIDIVQPVLLDRLPDDLPAQFTTIGQGLQGTHHDGLPIDMQVATGRRASIGETKPVGAESVVVAGHPATDLILDRPHEIADRHHRPGPPRQFPGDIGDLGFPLRMQIVVLVGPHPIAV